MTVRAAATVAATAAALAGGYAVYRHHAHVTAHAAKLAGRADLAQYRTSPLVLVVDVGSSSIRASCYALVDAHAGHTGGAIEWVMLQGSMQQLTMDKLIDANGEADMSRIARAVERAITDVLAFLRDAGLQHNVRGVGFSTFAMNLVGVDASGDVVTPVYTYAGRRPATAKYARELRDTLQERGCLDDWHNRTGAVVHPAYAAAEFLRLHHEEPELVTRVASWQSISGYLLGKWMASTSQSETDSTTTTSSSNNTNNRSSRAMPMSWSEASWTGVLEFRRNEWFTPLLELVHMDTAKMPPLCDSAQPIKGLCAAFSRQWPELEDVPFFLGVGDGAAANVGSKCTDASRIAITIGTSAALRVVLSDETMRERKVPRGLWCYRLGEGHVLLGGALNDGGSVFQFFCESLQLQPENVDAKLRKRQATQHGLTLLPFLSGERAPGWRDEATCTITGVHKWTSPLDLLHAGMESVALRIALVFSLVSEYADSEALVVASGTALTSSQSWRQMLADAIGRELVMEANAKEATSRGVAVLVGSYLGLHSLAASHKLATKSHDLVRSEPQVEAHAALLTARQQQETLYRKLYCNDQ